MIDDDLPDCPECLRLMVLALAKSAADPQNIALLPSEEAEKATKHLRELLGRPDDSLEQLAKLLAKKAKERVGIYDEH